MAGMVVVIVVAVAVLIGTEVRTNILSGLFTRNLNGPCGLVGLRLPTLLKDHKHEQGKGRTVKSRVLG